MGGQQRSGKERNKQYIVREFHGKDEKGCRATRSNVKMNQMSAQQVQTGSDLFDGSDPDSDPGRRQILIILTGS